MTVFKAKLAVINILFPTIKSTHISLTYYMKTQREQATDLICLVLKRGAILLTWDNGVYTYPGYKLSRPIEHAVYDQAKMIREVLRSLAYDSDPPPKYAVPWQQ